jgi:hypothetical protein
VLYIKGLLLKKLTGKWPELNLPGTWKGALSGKRGRPKVARDPKGVRRQNLQPVSSGCRYKAALSRTYQQQFEVLASDQEGDDVSSDFVVHGIQLQGA